MATLALGTTSAAQVRLAQPKTVTAPANQCKWTEPLPALPATCKAPPKLTDCGNTRYLESACGKENVIRQKYCAKVILEDFCKDGNVFEEVVRPSSAGLNQSVATATNGTGSLYVAPGAPRRGREVGAQVGSAPYSGRGFHSGALQQSGMTLGNNGRGSFATTFAPTWLTKFNSARLSMTKIYDTATLGAAVPPENNTLLTTLTAAASEYVGNGSPTAANKAVNSCAEYTYQRWYDVLRFRSAALALGRDFRGVYELATNPSSPVYLDKPTLKQFGVGDIPVAWPHVNNLPHNIFLRAKPSLVATPPPGTSAAQWESLRTAIMDRWNKFNPNEKHKYITISPTSRFDLHKRIRNNIESKYKPSDDAFDEADARKTRYVHLLASREEIAQKLKCAINPQLPTCCSLDALFPPSESVTPQQALIAKVKGLLQSNPNPVEAAAPWNQIRSFNYSNSFEVAEQLGLQSALRTRANQLLNVDGKLSVGGASLRSGSAPSSMQPGGASASGTFNTWRDVKNISATEKASCETKWRTQRSTLQAAMDGVNKHISDVVVREFKDPNGCMADPGNDLGNVCDWSYQMFTEQVLAFEVPTIEDDFLRCNEQTKGDFSVARTVGKQSKIWPCETRHDFGADQLDIDYFVKDVAPREVGRFDCEKKRAQEAVDNYLKENADQIKKIPLRGTYIGQSNGDTWTLPPEGGSSFGAYLTYSANWEVKGGNNNKKLDDGAWCKPVGKSSFSTRAGVRFFGKDLDVATFSMEQNTGESNDTHNLALAYRNFDNFTMKDLVKTGTKSGPGVALFPFWLLGSRSYSQTFTIGPVPCRVEFGAAAIAGVLMGASGNKTNANSCNNLKAPSEGLAYDFSTSVFLLPFANASAFAEAGMSIGVAGAGVSVDLTLLNLSAPSIVGAAVKTGKQSGFSAKSELNVNALSGRISAYVDAGPCPLCATYRATLFSWKGLNYSTRLWGSEAQFPLKLATWYAQSEIKAEDVKCLPQKHPNAPAGHPQCLKNPVESTKCADWKTPNQCPIPYNFRGPTN